MLYRKSFRLILAVALVASAAVARQKVARHVVPDTERLREHVTYLASDKLEGRRTGTPGAEEAARYVAEEFKRHGLAPGVANSITFQAGQSRMDGAFQGYFQTFPYVAGVELGKGNAMTLTTRAADASPASAPSTLDLRVGEDWMPLGFSASAHVENTPGVFVRFGITAADQNYDDYKDNDARGKIAVASSGTPDGDNPHGRFTRAGELRFKAAAARAAGAKALVVIASEENFKDDKLTALKYDNAGGDAGLPVAAISRQVAEKFLGLSAGLSYFEKEYRMAVNAVTEADKKKLPGPVIIPPFRYSLSVTTDIVRKSAPASNVVGVLEGSDPKLKSEVIVIGAHYDHLGRGGEGSLAPREGDIHHGADDNASGVAGLLELARLFSQERDRMRRTVLFIAFGGEEEGLIGSSYYVNHPARPLEQTVAMINMDMVGRLKDDALTVGGVGTASEWREWVKKANEGYKVSVEQAATGAREGANGDGSKSKQDSSRRDAAQSQDVLKQAQAKQAQKPDGALVVTS